MALTQISTAGVKDDAVTSGKIPANAVGSSELADNAVDTAAIANNAITTAKIADDAVTAAKLADDIAINTTGTITAASFSGPATNITVSSDTTDTLCFPIFTNTGTGNNAPKVNTNKLSFNSSSGALSATSFVGDGSNLTGVTSTTINNNANNRVITGSDTANSLEAEPNLTFDNTNYKLSLGSGGVIQSTSSGGNLAIGGGNTNPGGQILFKGGNTDANIVFKAQAGTSTPAERMRINNDGKVGIGTSSPTAKLHVDTSHYVPTSSGTSTTGIHLDGNPGNAGEYGGGISFGCGNSSGSAAAIAARQGTSDSDVIGMSFFTHDSSAGTADAVEKVRIHDGGSVSFNNGIILGNGLSYNSSNLMDDYEEGTFTPRLLKGATTDVSYAWRYGEYTRIGRLVTIHCAVGISSHDGSFSQLWLGGMPYNYDSLNNANAFQYIQLHGYSWASGYGDTGGTSHLFFELNETGGDKFRIVVGSGKSNAGSSAIGSSQRFTAVFSYVS